MRHYITHGIFVLVTIFSLSCGNANFLELGDDDKSFPSPGAPEGNDVISATTNQSGKEGENSPKLSPFAGAAFVQAPQINNYGSVTLQYAIETPPGRAGMQPGVGLSYSSSGGDGLVGIGWSLSTGLGVISRTTQNGQLWYDHHDTFTFNGQRLVKVEGQSGNENGVYRLEIESGFSKFELKNIENGGVWYVRDKAGTITIFGADRSSRIYHPSKPNKTYIWNFTRSTDLNGNYMYANYDTDDYEKNHIIYLKEILYTGNDKGNMDANQYVRFHYTKRNDLYVSKAPGFVMAMDKLLNYVEIGWDDPEGFFGNNTELWRYTMVYGISRHSKRPVLTTVDSTRHTTKPEFIYSGAERGFSWTMPENPEYDRSDYKQAFEKNPDSIKYFEGDFNGDGISDMVFFNPFIGRWKAAEGNRSGGFYFKDYSNENYIQRFKGLDDSSEILWFKGNVTGDYNGDGRSDIAFYLPRLKQFWVAQHNGKTFDFIMYSGTNLPYIDIFKCEWFPGDYDGNGLSDAVLFDEPTGTWVFMRNIGGGFQFIAFNRHFQNLFRDDFSPDQISLNSDTTADTSEYGKGREKIQFLSGDFNGDGRTDISLYDARSGRWWVAENYINAALGFDLQWKLYKEFTSVEKSLYTSQDALFCHDTFSGDFNGDGFSDFLVYKRDTREWVLAESHDGYLTFSIYAKMPRDIGDITRFMQGDFNGDGRTDVSFYSSDTQSLWVAESYPGGFDYYIYADLGRGTGPRPDAERVLDPTPLPEDEVMYENRTAVVADAQSTTAVNYAFDANYRSGKGERIFPGIYRSKDGKGISELLIYKRSGNGKGFYPKAEVQSSDSEKISALEGLNPDDEKVSLLNNGMPTTYNGFNAIFYYQTDESLFGTMTHSFNVIFNDSNKFDTKTIASFDNDVINFNISQHLYLFDDFNNDNNKQTKQLLLFNPGNDGNGSFELFSSDKPTTPLTIPIKSGDFDPAGLIENPLRYRFFSGKFLRSGRGIDDPAQILIVSMENGTHEWYLGTIDYSNPVSPVMSITRLDSDARLKAKGSDHFYRVLADGRLIYASINNGKPVFYALSIDSNSITEVSSITVQNDNPVFNGEFDHRGYPVVHDNNGLTVVDFGGATPQCKKLEPSKTITIERGDLLKDYYPYRWIQGDYNGDGKTDIGFFHLLERQWYFANSAGKIPDMMSRVRNGIGGTYDMEYINSSTLDNTGEDDISDLPMNYKICSRLEVNDGLDRRIATKYEYKDGYAFSGFINGYKETDYFGFGEFTVIDGYGNRTVNSYHNKLFTDFRKNRALAGGIKESRFFGRDQSNGATKEYSRTEYEYKIHEIKPNSITKSFLVEPVEVRKYNQDTLVQTTRSNIVLADNDYAMISKSEIVIDHYEDSIHQPVTMTGYTEFDNIDETNEMRVKLKKTLDKTSQETTTFYEYDVTTGNLKKETLRYTGSGLQGPEDRVMKYEYDDFGNVTRKINASGTPSRESIISYDSRLRQFVAMETAIGDAVALTTKYIINYSSAFGAAIEKKDPNGNGTYYEYDAFGRLLKQFTDTNKGKELLTRYSYSIQFPLSGKMTRYSGTDNSLLNFEEQIIETRIYADGMGRALHSVQTAMDDVPGKKYVKSGLAVYDSIGRVVRQSQTDWAGDNDIDVFHFNEAEKNPTITKYDPSGRINKVILPPARDGEEETSIRYTYNDPWEVIETHSVGRSKRTIKNARGQVLYVEDSGIGDDGVALSAAIGFWYDIAGNRILKFKAEADDENFKVQSWGDIMQIYNSHSSNENFPSETNAWWYDGFGQVISESDPDMGSKSVTYNAFGDVISTTDALGRTVSMIYDRLGRPVLKTLPPGEGLVAYAYDYLPDSENTLGRMVSIADDAQVKTFSYDRVGRVNREWRTIIAVKETYETNFHYDLFNRKTEITYPQDPATGNRLVVKYRYSNMGVCGISSDNGKEVKKIVSDVRYNEFGQMVSVGRGNGINTNYSYDVRGRLDRLVTTVMDGSTRKTLQDVAYSFKIDNSIKAIENRPEMDTNGVNGSITRYEYRYDGLNRLINADGSYEKNTGAESQVPNTEFPVQDGKDLFSNLETGNSKLETRNSTLDTITKKFKHSYVYAPNGNLMQKNIFDPNTNETMDSWHYEYQDHAVQNITSSKALKGGIRFAMTYDEVGNMIYQEDNEKGLKKRIDYDSNNRITMVTDPTTGEMLGEYEYDDQGLRIRKKSKRSFDDVDGQIEILYPSMYFGVERRLNEKGESGKGYAVNNVYLNGVRVAAISSQGDARYYLTDQVDSVKVVVDDKGKVLTRTEYLPFGETWFSEGDKGNKPKFNSQELDEETNFYFYNARYYDPQIARFVTADNIIPNELNTQSWNRFSYCTNNPIIYKDPTGHKEESGMLDSVKNKASNLYEGAKEKVSQAVDTVKGLFSDKQQLNWNLEDKKSSCSGNKVNTSSVKVGDKVIKITLTGDFCQSWGNSKNTKDVTAAIDSKAFKILMNTFAENNVEAVTFSGFGRPAEYDKVGNAHGELKNGKETGESFAFDITQIKFKDQQTITRYGALGTKNEDSINQLYDALEKNIKKYAPERTSEILTREYSKYIINGNTSKVGSEATHDVHDHISIAE